MSNAIFQLKKPVNEPVLEYRPGSKERKELEKVLEKLKSQVMEIPVVIGNKEIFTGKTVVSVLPHNKEHHLANIHLAAEREIEMAVESALKAKALWENMPWQHRASVFLKAAELISGPYRATINAATMLAQSKTVHQAEIDAACELIDFFRFNAYFMQEIYSEQAISTSDNFNRMDYRPLEGFIFAVTPFNFTSIGGNLPTAPAMMGNTVVWKPAQNAAYSNYFVMKILIEAGMPAGVINFVPANPRQISDYVFSHPDFAGLHYTGSTAVFNEMWKKIGNNIENYRSYPKIVGETGGKDFIFAHHTADVDALVIALIRGAFEYQGQKCSAASRGYIPKSLWPRVKDKLLDTIKKIKLGDIEDFTVFMGAVIDRRAFDKIKGYIDVAKASEGVEVLYGGGASDEKGFFIEPTVLVTQKPEFITMKEEIFGPVLTLYVYEDEQFEKALELCEGSTQYALTGAVFAQDRNMIVYLEQRLIHAAGNFYINDKPTGAVVGQQPFGGARGSGTNDKAGSKQNLMRWVSPRAIKENFVPPTCMKYPYMD